MNPKSAIQKGKELENFVAELLVKSGIDRQASRQIGSGNGKKKGDIATSIPWTIECKNTKTLKWKEASEQVKREAMGYQKEVVIWHPPHKPLDQSIAIININDFIELLERAKNQERAETILDKYQIKNNLEKAVYHLKQVVKEL